MPPIVPMVLSQCLARSLLLPQRWPGLAGGVSRTGRRRGPHDPGMGSNTPGIGVPQLMHRPSGVSR